MKNPRHTQEDSERIKTIEEAEDAVEYFVELDLWYNNSIDSDELNSNFEKLRNLIRVYKGE